MTLPTSCAVLVVGSGNAGLSAAISAAESGASSVVLVDKCPAAWAGGNTYFTAGGYRTAHAGLPDLLPLVNNVYTTKANTTDSQDLVPASSIDMDPYSADDFYADLQRVTQNRADPALGRILARDSGGAVQWLHRQAGVRFQLSFNRQAYRVDDGSGGGPRWKFWGGLALKTQDGGKGLVADLLAAATQKHGVQVYFDTPLIRLVTAESPSPSGTAVIGAVLRHAGREVQVRAASVVLAAGGFEANPALRAQYLGPGWDLAHVRGSPHNTGDALGIAARDAGARLKGNWSGCHSVAWDADAPRDGGDREVTNEFTKSGYPLGVMVNAEGARFVDEGVDFRNYTYARFGRAILGQPDGVAWQVWDARTSGMLRAEEYRDEIVRKVTAGSVEALAAELARPANGLRDAEAFVRTVREYNEAVYAHRKAHPGRTFNPAVKDGVATLPGMLQVPKTNWALPLDRPPFLAVKVSCGVTFTFGGLAVDPETAGVVAEATGKPVEGLYAVGEMLGGLYYGNYPGGSGLTAGTVWGRRAGRDAARLAEKKKTAAKL